MGQFQAFNLVSQPRLIGDLYTALHILTGSFYLLLNSFNTDRGDYEG